MTVLILIDFNYDFFMLNWKTTPKFLSIFQVIQLIRIYMILKLPKVFWFYPLAIYYCCTTGIDINIVI